MISAIDSALFPGFSNFVKVGAGTYGTVYTAKHEKTGAQIAVKTVDLINLMTQTNRTVLASELNIYEKIDHPYLTQCYGHFEDQCGVYIVLENVAHGSLLNEIMRKGKIHEPDALRMFCQLISAIRYLHEEAKIIHRDIKPENILLDENDDIRLIDFGLSETMTGVKKTFDEKCGSFPYSAPEMLKGQRYSTEIDIWSAGVTLYVMVTGVQPFTGHSMKEIFKQIAYYEPPYPSNLSPALVDLLKRMLIKNPAERITLDEIEHHPWIEGSRFYYTLLPEFWQKACHKVVPRTQEDINTETVKKLNNLGFDTSTLVDDIINHNLNEASILYRYFTKKEMMDKIRSPSEVRAMFYARKKKDRNSCCIEASMFSKTAPLRMSSQQIISSYKKGDIPKLDTSKRCETKQKCNQTRLPRLSPIIKKTVFL